MSMSNESPNNVKLSPASERKRIFPGWYLVAASWVMLFLAGAVGFGIFFKPILDEFSWDREKLSLVQTAAMLLFAMTLPFLGRLIDRFGPKTMLYICVGTQTLTSAVNGMAASLWQLSIGRLLLEIKGLHAAQVLINRWFVEKRGRAQGIMAMGMPMGMLVLTPLSQWLVLNWGWRQTYFFWAGITFIILLPLTIFIKERPEDNGYGPDGKVLSRKSIDINPNWTRTSGVEKEGKRGVHLDFLRKGSFWLLAGTELICGIGCGFMVTHIVIFATDIGYSPMIGASFLSVQGGVNLAGVLVTGYMSDRLARGNVLGMTHFIRSMALFTIATSLLVSGGALWQLYIAMVLFGFGHFTTSPLVAGLVGDLFSHRNMGLTLGIVLSLHMVGAALGAFSGGFVYETRGSYFLFFPVQGSLELLAGVFAFVIAASRKREARSYKQ
jgi:MFS family permease